MSRNRPSSMQSCYYLLLLLLKDFYRVEIEFLLKLSINRKVVLFFFFIHLYYDLRVETSVNYLLDILIRNNSIFS